MTDYYPPQAEVPPPPPPYPDKASGMAITALVLGILALPCCCNLFAGIPALIIGFIEKGKIERNQSSPKGKWMAFVGIIMGCLSFVWGCLWSLWVFFGGGMAAIENMTHRF